MSKKKTIKTCIDIIVGMVCALLFSVPAMSADEYGNISISHPKPYITDGYVVDLHSLEMNDEYIKVSIFVTALKTYNSKNGVLLIANNSLSLVGLDENGKILSIHRYLPYDSRASLITHYQFVQVENHGVRPGKKLWWPKKKELTAIDIYFGGTFPKGVKKFSILSSIEPMLFTFKDVEIDTFTPTESRLRPMNEEQLKNKIDSISDDISGIYESNNRKYALLKEGNKYQMYYADERKLDSWAYGDRKATLYRTGVDFNLEGRIRTQNEKCFEDAKIEVNPFKIGIYTERYKFGLFGNTDRITELMCVETFHKIYPTADAMNQRKQVETAQKWSGTGFALLNGYVVTNYHVADEAREIEIFGVNGDFTTPHKAKVIGVDKVADIALLRLCDEEVFPKGLPYGVKAAMSEVGEDVFVLGYPLIGTMGEEIKLTNGIISSRSGFEGDVTNYQISVPIQPGNSGGPMFDANGNVVGIVCAKHRGAENVGYAIKTSYLLNLIESVASSDIVPHATVLKGKPLKEQVKMIKDYTYLIKCSK